VPVLDLASNPSAILRGWAALRRLIGRACGVGSSLAPPQAREAPPPHFTFRLALSVPAVVNRIRAFQGRNIYPYGLCWPYLWDLAGPQSVGLVVAGPVFGIGLSLRCAGRPYRRICPPGRSFLAAGPPRRGAFVGLADGAMASDQQPRRVHGLFNRKRWPRLFRSNLVVKRISSSPFPRVWPACEIIGSQWFHPTYQGTWDQKNVGHGVRTNCESDRDLGRMQLLRLLCRAGAGGKTIANQDFD